MFAYGIFAKPSPLPPDTHPSDAELAALALWNWIAVRARAVCWNGPESELRDGAKRTNRSSKIGWDSELREQKDLPYGVLVS